MPFPRPGEALDGGLGAGEAWEVGRRLPGVAAEGVEEAPPVGGVGDLTVLPAGLLLLEPMDVSVRFKAAGPISACGEG